MSLISFAYTTQALLNGHKTVTRREWNDKYAKQFHKGDIVDVWDRLPRAKGKKVARIRITHDPYKERLGDMPDTDIELEGYGPQATVSGFIEAFGGDPNLEVWVVRFELLDILEDLG